MIVALQVDWQQDGSRCRILHGSNWMMCLNMLCKRIGLSVAFQNSECYFWSIYVWLSVWELSWLGPSFESQLLALSRKNGIYLVDLQIQGISVEGEILWYTGHCLWGQYWICGRYSNRTETHLYGLREMSRLVTFWSISSRVALWSEIGGEITERSAEKSLTVHVWEWAG